MIIKTCDRCRCTIDISDKADIGKKIGKYMVLRTNQAGVNVRSIYARNLEPLDLCSYCARELTQFIEDYVSEEKV